MVKRTVKTPVVNKLLRIMAMLCLYEAPYNCQSEVFISAQISNSTAKLVYDIGS